MGDQGVVDDVETHVPTLTGPRTHPPPSHHCSRTPCDNTSGHRPRTPHQHLRPRHPRPTGHRARAPTGRTPPAAAPAPDRPPRPRPRPPPPHPSRSTARTRTPAAAASAERPAAVSASVPAATDLR
ncbi:hypothetical protein GCM10010510_69730 [Streptomyces anandii JCM 4720]|nr:hypothetical protein GCM10010510_69730 [Streptomyces anandii JCM 4720]